MPTKCMADLMTYLPTSSLPYNLTLRNLGQGYTDSMNFSFDTYAAINSFVCRQIYDIPICNFLTSWMDFDTLKKQKCIFSRKLETQNWNGHSSCYNCMNLWFGEPVAGFQLPGEGILRNLIEKVVT